MTMKIKDQEVILSGTAGNIKIQRMPDGFPRIESDAEIDLHYGLGYMHGHDRQMHMWLMKIVGQGMASECIKADKDLNHLGEVAPMTLPMSSYRADRIQELLEKGESLTTEDMKKIHYDLYSKQAEAFMEIIKPQLPSTQNGEILKNWDRRYDAASLGATLFERIYRELLKLVFGENGMGVDVVGHMITDTSMFAMLHGNFDQVLLKETSAWFADQSREQIYQMAIDRGLSKPAIPYGQTRKIYILNLFFGGKLPKIFGFDYGPYEHIGSRATIPQSQIFRAMGQSATFAASYRMIADLDNDELLNNLPGGPSDRRFSKYYKTGLTEWMSARYHVYKP
jgi:penicillin amidase